MLYSISTPPEQFKESWFIYGEILHQLLVARAIVLVGRTKTDGQGSKMAQRASYFVARYIQARNYGAKVIYQEAYRQRTCYKRSKGLGSHLWFQQYWPHMVGSQYFIIFWCQNSSDNMVLAGLGPASFSACCPILADNCFLLSRYTARSSQLFWKENRGCSELGDG